MAEIVLAAFDRKPLSNASAALPNSLSIAIAKPALTSFRATRSCGRLGPASEGSTEAELELEHVGEHRVRRVLGAVHALRLGVGGDEGDARLPAAPVLRR